MKKVEVAILSYKKYNVNVFYIFVLLTDPSVPCLAALGSVSRSLVSNQDTVYIARMANQTFKQWETFYIGVRVLFCVENFKQNKS